MACNETNLVAFEYMSITGQWNILACINWRCSLGVGMTYSRYSSSCLDYEKGCFYWVVPWRNNFLVLDGLSMKLSVLNNNLAKYDVLESGMPVVVRGGDGTAEVFFLADCFGDGPTDLIHFTKQTDGGSSDEWKFENMVSLPKQYYYFTLGAADGFLFLRGILQDQHAGCSSEDSLDNSSHLSVELPNMEYFSFDLKTSELKKVCAMKWYFHTLYPFYGYPPTFGRTNYMNWQAWCCL